MSTRELISKWEDALEEVLCKVAILARQEELSDEDLENAAGVRLRSGVLAGSDSYAPGDGYMTICD